MLASAEVLDARLISIQPSRRRPIPTPVYEGQDLSALKQGINPYETDPGRAFPFTPEVKLYLRTIHNAQLIVDDGLDGVIVTQSGLAIAEPSCFSNLSSTSHSREIGSIALGEVEYQDIFVAFDGAWGNYFHWTLQGLAKASIAYSFLPENCRIFVPDYRSRVGGFRLTFSETTYDQTIAAFGAATVPGGRAASRWVERVPRGRYQARRIHYLWTDPKLPTDIFYMDRFHQVFSEMRNHLKRTDRYPKRLLISRAKSDDKRISDADQAALERLAQDRGFQRVFLEDMSHDEQAEAFFNADAVVAPHGAGLANVVFGQRGLKVLELNSDLDGSGYVRGCFYQLAVERGLKYLFLNGSAGEFTEDNFQRSLDLICSS